MSKLGAICDKLEKKLDDKLRQNGTSNGNYPFSDTEDIGLDLSDTKTPRKRELSPMDSNQRLNKRKNFHPVSINRLEKSAGDLSAPKSPSSADSPQENNGHREGHEDEEPKLATVFKDETESDDDRISPKQTSVIVKNPRPPSPPSSSDSESPPPSNLANINSLLQRRMYNGYLENSRLLNGPFGHSGSQGIFNPQQCFPFVDYRTMSLLYRPGLSSNNVDDSLNMDDDDNGSVADSEDGKLSSNATSPSERLNGNSSNERESQRENGSHDSDGWKWSGVRNSIRSLDIWQYVKHYKNDEICQSAECRSLGLKEHFHCLTCPNKVIFRKEEMIRHVKWHKKRDETLQLGFLRFSGSDDCSQQFAICPHAGRQTHYHCLMNGCQKVYTSTSDVQMHANLHRKEMAINKEGFRRYRAMDDCREETCPFRDQKSTHFHCIRSSCTFTFKNKADMEKHKAYHAKNDELAKDGFRKYMKYEHCMFENCPYSKIMNHIHCIRNGCRYVFTSSAQLHAHKRKHDKNDILFMPATNSSGNQIQKRSLDDVASSDSEDSELRVAAGNNFIFSSDDEDAGEMSSDYMDLSRKKLNAAPQLETTEKSGAFNVSLLRAAEMANRNAALKQRQQTATSDFSSAGPIDYGSPQARKNMAVSHSASDISARSGLPFTALHRSPYSSQDFHAHSQGGSMASLMLSRPFMNGVDHAGSVTPFLAQKPSGAMDPLSAINSLNALVNPTQMSYPPFKRKRGRPPKNPVIDVHVFPSVPNANHNPQAMFSSFKLGKGGVLMDVRQESACAHRSNSTGFSNTTNHEKPRERNILPKLSQEHERLPNKSPNCTYQSCFYKGKNHFHCAHPRCHFASERDDILALHSREFHANIEILEGYEFFDQSVDCQLPGCPSNRLTRHFHCTRQQCFYSFVRYDTMATHEEKHRVALEMQSPSTPSSVTRTPLLSTSPVTRAPLPSPTPETRTRLPSPSPETRTRLPSPSPETRTRLPSPVTRTQLPSPVTRTPLPSPSPVTRTGFTRDHLDVKQEPHTPKNEDFEQGHFFFHPMLSNMHFFPGKPCDHRMCRMSEREHFHCSRCQHPYTSSLRLQTHLTKCRAEVSPPPTLNPPKFEQNSGPSSLSSRRSPSTSGDSEEHDLSRENPSGQKKIKFIPMEFSQNGRTNGQQHQPVLDGFHRFLCNETCDWEECPLSKKQTHWHCQEEHCRQFFSDKTRLLRHSERHRRLATIIGDDFRRYSSKVSCDDENCSLKHSSHVHCLQCEFTCTETAKISTHRRSHSKQHAVTAAGFDKFSFRSPCSISSCLYYTQTHYHCKTCAVVVNTMSQMQMHQYKHDQDATANLSLNVETDVDVDTD